MIISRITHLISGLAAAGVILYFTSSTTGRNIDGLTWESIRSLRFDKRSVNPPPVPAAFNAGFILHLHEKGERPFFTQMGYTPVN